MIAVFFDGTEPSQSAAVFSDDPISDAERGEIERLHGEIREDVSLEVPPDLYEWREGADRPQNILCVSRSDPKHFRAFKYSRQINPAEYIPMGKPYFIAGAWEDFLETLTDLRAITSITDETDRPGLDEEIMRGIDANRPPGHRHFEGMY